MNEIELQKRRYKELVKPLVCVTVSPSKYKRKLFDLYTEPFPPYCDKCKCEIKPYQEKFYGWNSNFVEMVDVEYSHETGFCRECAIKMATEARSHKYWVDYTYTKEIWLKSFGEIEFLSDGAIEETMPFEQAIKEIKKNA